MTPRRFCPKCFKTEAWSLFRGWTHLSEVDAVICEVEW